jgi:hypothetical protein
LPITAQDKTPISEWGVSDDEEDLVPITKLIATDKQPVRGHRKDNSEWCKRKEKHLGQIERRQQAKEGSSNPTVIPFIPCIKLMSEREKDETTMFAWVNGSKSITATGLEFVPMVASLSLLLSMKMDSTYGMVTPPLSVHVYTFTTPPR